MELPEKLKSAIDQLSKIPGIGEKTAIRQSLSLAKWSVPELVEFAAGIKGLADLKKCYRCGFFSDEEICSICASKDRLESKTICVVESITDCLAIERSNNYNGLYFVLGGVLNPLLGIGPDELNINSLVDRVKKEAIKEIILAINPSVEGDATCSYLKQCLPSTVKIDRIGFGIPIGGNLEYLDSLTISKALENRRLM